MATADTINSIRTHLTADYEALENIGAELENVDKNIENIASCLEEVYDNLPKVSGEGTSITLSPTLKGKMNIIPKRRYKPKWHTNTRYTDKYRSSNW